MIRGFVITVASVALGAAATAAALILSAVITFGLSGTGAPF